MDKSLINNFLSKTDRKRIVIYSPRASVDIVVFLCFSAFSLC